MSWQSNNPFASNNPFDDPPDDVDFLDSAGDAGGQDDVPDPEEDGQHPPPGQGYTRSGLQAVVGDDPFRAGVFDHAEEDVEDAAGPPSNDRLLPPEEGEAPLLPPPLGDHSGDDPDHGPPHEDDLLQAAKVGLQAVPKRKAASLDRATDVLTISDLTGRSVRMNFKQRTNVLSSGPRSGNPSEDKDAPRGRSTRSFVLEDDPSSPPRSSKEDITEEIKDRVRLRSRRRDPTTDAINPPSRKSSRGREDRHSREKKRAEDSRKDQSRRRGEDRADSRYRSSRVRLRSRGRSSDAGRPEVFPKNVSSKKRPANDSGGESWGGSSLHTEVPRKRQKENPEDGRGALLAALHVSRRTLMNSKPRPRLNETARVCQEATARWAVDLAKLEEEIRSVEDGSVICTVGIGHGCEYFMMYRGPADFVMYRDISCSTS